MTQAKATPRLMRETERLRLTALTAEALEAWIDGDPDRLCRETGARFVEPIRVPPLFDEDLPVFRDRMREAPGDLGWWVWLITTRIEGEPVGVCGLGGRPFTGSTTLGYSVFPEHEGCGYATEASRALVEWALVQPGTRAIRATAPEAHHASVAVARKIGMIEVGREVDPDVGELVVLEVGRE